MGLLADECKGWFSQAGLGVDWKHMCVRVCSLIIVASVGRLVLLVHVTLNHYRRGRENSNMENKNHGTLCGLASLPSLLELAR